MTNTARRIIWPNDGNIVARIVFLYVGQGDCTIVLVACPPKRSPVLMLDWN